MTVLQSIGCGVGSSVIFMGAFVLYMDFTHDGKGKTVNDHATNFIGFVCGTATAFAIGACFGPSLFA